MFSKGYVPNVLVAGNVNEFRAQLERNQPVNVVGSVAFVGKVGGQPFDVFKDQKFVLNGQLVELNTIKTLNFDHLVFNDHMDYLRHAQFLAVKVIPGASIITLDFFSRNVGDRFYSRINDDRLFRLLYQQKIRSLLDADAYFADGQRYTKTSHFDQLSIDCIRGDRQNYAINDNIYARIYDSPLDCRLRHYDAILLTAEREVDDLYAAIDYFYDRTDSFIVFARRGINVKQILNDHHELQPGNAVRSVGGNWIELKKNPASSIAVYVVAHKTHAVALPEGYVTIHAGRALGTDLGYLGDDSGDNISTLNPYLNELTAMYWIWKNATQDVVGLSHYRRFFSTANSNKFNVENILPVAQALELLKQFDMIVGNEAFSSNSQSGLMVFDAEYDAKLAYRAINLIKKMLERYQPDYVDSFEQIMHNQGFFCCNMMIARKHVFDAYCQWLFSFLLPAADEFIPLLADVTVRRKRILGFIAERMFGVWLLKNHLRLRELTIMVAQ